MKYTISIDTSLEAAKFANEHNVVPMRINGFNIYVDMAYNGLAKAAFPTWVTEYEVKVPWELWPEEYDVDDEDYSPVHDPYNDGYADYAGV